MNISVDFGTIVQSLALAGILYIARTINQIDRKMAVLETQAVANESFAKETRARVIQAEEKIGVLEVAVAEIKSKR